MNRSRSPLAAVAFVLVLFVVANSTSVGAEYPTVRFNEILVGNASTNMDYAFTNYSSWIELHNSKGTPLNLAGYRLRWLGDGEATPVEFTIRSGVSIPGGGYLQFWADEEDTGLHTNFELDMDGGVLTLLDAGGVEIESVFLNSQEPDVSVGRLPGGTDWYYFDQPTPGAANTTPAFAAINFAAPPSFSVSGGHYGSTQLVEISTADPTGTVHYTLDGSKPTAGSDVYAGAITVNRTTVIRATTFSPDKMTSPTVTHTYLINEPTSLPTIAIATDPDHLFNSRIGIYVVGTNGITNCRKKANWHQPWERPASMEMYEANGDVAFIQDVGFEIHGNCTRNLPNKSFEIKARKLYGDNDIDYKFFEHKPITSFKRVILRNSGQDTSQAMVRDGMIQTLVRGQMDLDYQEYRPAVLYLNGKYWGIYNIREKMDENFVESNYDIDETEFDMLDNGRKVYAGNTDDWNAFQSYLRTHNLADPAVYEYIQTQMDVSEFIDYQILEIYAANANWPHNSVRTWRAYGPDGRWRWALVDLDAGFGRSTARASVNTLRLATARKGRGADATLFLRSLLNNPEFKAEFMQRFATRLNSTYAPARVNAHIDAVQSVIADEMPDHIARWGKPPTMAKWTSQVNMLHSFANSRPKYVFNQLNRYFKYPGLADLTIAGSGSGSVLVAGAEVPAGYHGPHFRGIPITLEAIPQAGATFVEWLETGSTSPIVQVTLASARTLTAVFGDAPVPQLVLNEVHYNPAGDDVPFEFIEIVNIGQETVALTDFQLSGVNYVFPTGAAIDPDEYILVVSQAATYATLDNQVFQWTSGDLDNGGETIQLRDPFGNVLDEVSYDDTAPWTSVPDGNGPSLSLISPDIDNVPAGNWQPSNKVGGTPGEVNFMPLPALPLIVINEIHYLPSLAQGTETDFEFLELVNNSSDEVDLSGYRTVGVTFTFATGSIIGPGETIVLAQTSATYQNDGYQVFNWTSGGLSNGGEWLALIDPAGFVVDSVAYGVAPPWPTNPAGLGPSLELEDPGSDNQLPVNWVESSQIGGSPGQANSLP
jgi:hypothetical protein